MASIRSSMKTMRTDMLKQVRDAITNGTIDASDLDVFKDKAVDMVAGKALKGLEADIDWELKSLGQKVAHGVPGKVGKWSWGKITGGAKAALLTGLLTAGGVVGLGVLASAGGKKSSSNVDSEMARDAMMQVQQPSMMPNMGMQPMPGYDMGGMNDLTGSVPPVEGEHALRVKAERAGLEGPNRAVPPSAPDIATALAAGDLGNGAAARGA